MFHNLHVVISKDTRTIMGEFNKFQELLLSVINCVDGRFKIIVPSLWIYVCQHRSALDVVESMKYL